MNIFLKKNRAKNRGKVFFLKRTYKRQTNLVFETYYKLRDGACYTILNI
jgi:hypothetical protein